MADHGPIRGPGAERGGANQQSPHPARCILLVPPGRETPAALVSSLTRRGVDVHIEHDPILALAELGRCVIEQRRRAEQVPAGFHRRGAVEIAGMSRTGLILLLVEPGDFIDSDLLVECAARSMPAATIAVYDAKAPLTLRIVSRSPSIDAAFPPRGNGAVDRREGGGADENGRPAPDIVVRRARPALRLAGVDAVHREDDDATRASVPTHHSEPSVQGSDERDDAAVESLITAEELAMLLGDADEIDAPPGTGGGR